MARVVRGSVWDPFSEVVRQFDNDFDTIVRRAFGPTGRRASEGFVPAADVDRDGADVVITLELAGVDTENLDVEVSDGRLRISGNRTDSTSSESQGALVREIRTGAFRREFALPEHVTADDIDADYDNGLLSVRVRGIAKPKVEPRKITVRGAEPKAVEADEAAEA